MDDDATARQSWSCPLLVPPHILPMIAALTIESGK